MHRVNLTHHNEFLELLFWKIALSLRSKIHLLVPISEFGAPDDDSYRLML